MKVEINPNDPHADVIEACESLLLAWADRGGAYERAERYQKIMDWSYHTNAHGIHALCVQGRAESVQDLRDYKPDYWTYAKLGQFLGISRQAVHTMLVKYHESSVRDKRKREQRLRNASARLPQ